MIEFLISEGRDGRTVCRYGSVVLEDDDPVGRIARDLVEEGVEDQPWQQVRDGVVVLYGASLFLLAARVLSETPEGLVLKWWRQHPKGGLRPVLAVVVAGLISEAASRKKRTPNRASAKSTST